MVRRGRLRKALTDISQHRTLQACFCAFLSSAFFLTTPSRGGGSLLTLSVEEESKSQTTETVTKRLGLRKLDTHPISRCKGPDVLPVEADWTRQAARENSSIFSRS